MEATNSPHRAIAIAGRKGTALLAWWRDVPHCQEEMWSWVGGQI